MPGDKDVQFANINIEIVVSGILFNAFIAAN